MPVPAYGRYFFFFPFYNTKGTYLLTSVGVNGSSSSSSSSLKLGNNKNRWTLQLVLKPTFCPRPRTTKNPYAHGWSVWNDSTNFIQNDVNQGKYYNINVGGHT